MNIKAIGAYIQALRKGRGLSQKDLALRLGVTFQAVSKWETGENLPDAAILLDLAAELDTTTDKLLCGGILPHRASKIDLQVLRDGICALQDIGNLFGEQSVFYRGAVEGIGAKLHLDVAACLATERGREELLAWAVREKLSDGYTVETDELEEAFSLQETVWSLKKHLGDCALFCTKAADYQNHRPCYPDAVAKLVSDLLNAPVIADIGSGTGRLSQILLPIANTLYAVEPNKQMRVAACRLLGQYANYVPIAATAERTTLPDKSVDVITVAEAYHWFDSEMTRAEFHRILKPDGYVFLLWNEFGGDEYDAEKQALDGKYRAKTKLYASGIPKEQRAKMLFGDGNYRAAVFDNLMMQTREEFCGGWSSASYIPRAGTDGHRAFLQEAEALFDKYAVDGILKTTVKTVCFYGKISKTT